MKDLPRSNWFENVLVAKGIYLDLKFVEYHLVEKIIGRMASAKWSKIKVEKFDLDV